MAEETQEPEPFDRLDDVDLYRAEQFQRLGFGDIDTLFLLVAGADWHKAEQLVEKLEAGGFDRGHALAWTFDYLR